MNTLKTQLESAKIDTASLRTLADHVREHFEPPLDDAEWDGPEAMYVLEAARLDSLKVWESLRRMTPDTGYYPVILGGMDELGRHMESIAFPEENTAAETLRLADAIHPKTWLDNYRRSEPGLFENPPRSHWPSQARPITEFATLSPNSVRESAEVFIGLVPTIHSQEVPAYLHWGGWNDCPMPEVHVAVQRDWQARYGSEIVVVHHDLIECRVARPTTTREDALALADEQFAYCYDLVYQGTETLDALAAGLLNGTVWYFWWD